MNKTLSNFWLFFICNVCFFCLQLAFIYSENGSFISEISLPSSVYRELGMTLVIHLSLYALLALFQILLLHNLLKTPFFSSDHAFIMIWSMCACAILCANAYFFPLSAFSKLISPPLSPEFIAILFGLSLSGILFLILLSFYYYPWLGLIGLVVLSLISINWYNNPSFLQKSGMKPNIIILGIDSLSPENVTTNTMPFLYSLLQNSIQFTQAISPLSRTYPAWASMLTGLYAEHHHAEENLVPKSLVQSKKSVIWTLNQQGYNTVYATDDRRFNSLTQDFGFQHIIGPKLGVNDVILGTFNDFPLSNLLINLGLSARIFPYNYINRASFFSYYPHSFNLLLQKKLSQLSHNQPLFLAVHFTLPHWPYAWAESDATEVNDEFSLRKRAHLYQNALQKVDKQFAAFYQFLQNHNYFHTSIVTLLSDHGEVLYGPNTRLTNYQNYKGKPPSPFALYLKEKTATELDKSAGHGSDILSPQQYHSVLAFKVYQDGKTITSNLHIMTRVALIDLAPTIWDYLHLKPPFSMDGISLLPYILNAKNTLPERPFFIESGMCPNQLLSKKKAMELGAKFYKVNPSTNELEIKSDKLVYFNEQKLYGIISGHWILALYPNETHYIAVIQNLTNGEWTDDLHSEFAKKTPATHLYQQLKGFYGNKIDLFENPLNEQRYRVQLK